MSIRQIDNRLIDKLDSIYTLVEESGVESFINTEDSLQAFGSYNIFKEEYISIERISDTTLYELIEYTKRAVEGEVFDFRVISASFEYGGNYYLIEIGLSLTSINVFQKHLKSFAFYFLIVLLTLTIILDLSITQYLLKPFGQIIERLKNSNHPKNFDYTPVHTSTSDFKYLEENIHGLMKKIENVFNDERDYISNISHELLTPISIIRSKLENFVNNTSLSDDELVKIYESRVTLGRLTKLVRTLLLLSRIDNDEYLLIEKVNLYELLERIAIDFQEHFEQKNIEFELLSQIKDIEMFGNKDLLHILFFNLINNAIKYTPEGGQIILKQYIENKMLIVELIDNGIGISKENLPYIFSRFKKFQGGDNNFGLGLALVKKIIDYHQFSIEVDSEIQRGTRFLLNFGINSQVSKNKASN